MHNEGQFDAEIMDHGFMAGNKGPQLWVKFKTSQGQITAFLHFTPDASEYSVKKVRAMGFQGDDLSQLGDGKALAGNLCSITVYHDTYNGETRAKVSYIDPLGGGGWQGEKDPGAASDASAYNALLRSEPKINATKVEDPQQYDEMNPPPGDDDYPDFL